MRPSLRSITLLLLLLVGHVETHADTVRSAANVAGSTQDYPAKQVRIIDPFGAGGGPDLLARALAPKLSELWGQPVTVKKLSNHRAMIALAIGYHNLCRYHASLRCTPCMAQGITKTIWSIEDLLTATT